MGIQVQWYNPQQDILLYTFQSRWTWKQLFEARTIGSMMINAAGRDKVGQIFYFEDELKLPSNSLLHWRKFAATTESEMVQTVLYAPKSPDTARRFLKVFYQEFRKIPKQFIAAENLIQAAVQLHELVNDRQSIFVQTAV